MRSEPSNRVAAADDDDDSFSFLSDLDMDRLAQDVQAQDVQAISGPGYLLTYVDDDLLIGKQTDSPGQFVFCKA